MTKIHVKRLYTASLDGSVDIVALHFEPNITFSRLVIFKQINTFCIKGVLGIESRTLHANQIVYLSSSQYFLKSFKVNLSNKYDREIELL